MQWQTESFGLGFDEDSSYPMNDDAVGVTVERDGQADDVDGGFVTGGVQRDGAVLTATSTHPRSGSLPAFVEHLIPRTDSADSPGRSTCRRFSATPL